ncbi:MAG: ATP-binding cassette domain-containing protein [Pseudomonadota bacterium]
MVSLLPLNVSNASVTRQGQRLLGPVDLTLDGEGLTIVLGPNGAGKTTLLRLIHGLERSRKGSVAWSAPEADARRGQAFVFQTPIMMRRSVLECLVYPLRLSGISREAARTRAREAASRVGLNEVLDLPAQQISGGEKQKLAIARALIQSPQVLLLDEPTSNLDGRSTREIEEILHSARTVGTRILMSTHDLGQARRLADEVIFLARGALLEHRPADRFFSAPETDEARAFLEGRIIE